MQLINDEALLNSGGVGGVLSGVRRERGESLNNNKNIKIKLFIKSTPPVFCRFVGEYTVLSSLIHSVFIKKQYKSGKNRGGGLNNYHFLGENYSV